MLTCKEYAEMKKKVLKEYIAEEGLNPRLAVIQVGDRPESNSYIRGKKKDCEEVGINCMITKFDENISEETLINWIRKFNSNKDINGIIVQLPLPDHIDVKRIQSWIKGSKDVDGFSMLSQFDPCTPAGVIGYLKAVGYEFEGKDALVIGRSDIVGKPLARMLTDLDCTVTLAHSKSKRLMSKISDADILFTCTNKIEYYDASWLNYPYEQPRAIVDIGLGIGNDGKLHGNIYHKLVESIKREYPERICISGTGGVGLLTRVALLENVVRASEM